MKYAAKKTAMMLLTMVIVSFLTFVAFSLLSGDAALLAALDGRMRGEAHNYEELFRDYADAGCWEEALAVADAAIAHVAEPCPMLEPPGPKRGGCCGCSPGREGGPGVLLPEQPG